MSEEDKWEALIKSIQKAARILGKDLTERDMPDHLNWFVGRNIHDELWGEVYRRRKHARNA